MRVLAFFAVLHTIAPAIAVMGDFVFGGHRRPLRDWVIVYLIYFYWAAALNLGLLLSLPLLALLLISGPGAVLGLLVSVVGLGYYLIERVIGYNIPGSSFHGDDRDALFLVGLLIVSLLLLTLLWKLDGDTAIDRFGGWLGDGFRRPLRYLEKQLEEN